MNNDANVSQPRPNNGSSNSFREAAAAALAARLRAAREASASAANTKQQSINLLRAENLITEQEAKKLERQIEPVIKPQEPTQLQPGQPAMRALERFVTCDPELVQVKEHVKILATVNHPVLIRGDSGTGKELIARALHGNRTGPFVAINCAAISPNLIESELFGHVKGSFTGAFNDRAGLLLRATSGTAFLDEVGDLPYELQAKLLRAIQNRVIRRVGSNEDEIIDCRIVSATHVGIESELNERFRLDLYYRLSTFVLDLKPIKDRTREDFELIVAHFKGDADDVERLWRNKQRMNGNFRNIEQYFVRKQVLGQLMYL